MPGPLPNPNRRRRNAPTIPTTVLPARGRSGVAPSFPSWIALADAGKAWWAWAWQTPQASAWSDGDLVVIARRATLEDDLAALHKAPSLDIAEVLELEEDEQVAQVEWIMRTLARLAGGKSSLAREARELDDRLGLTPKGFAALRWTIEEPKAKPTRRTQAPKRMRVIDGGAS